LKKLQKRLVPATTTLILVALSIVWLYPLMLIVFTAFRSVQEIAMAPFSLPSTWAWTNFVEAWHSAHFCTVFANSTLITATTTALLALLAPMAAYPLSRYPTKLNSAVYLLFVSLIMIPFQLAMIPLYRLIKALGLVNHRASIVFVDLALLLPFSIFLITGFIRTVPKEIDESGFMDGAGDFRIFFALVYPLLKPAIATLVVLNALGVWNDFLPSLLFLQSSELRTIPLSLFVFQGQYNVNWGPLFAAVTLAMLPMIFVYLFLQRWIIKGMAAGAVKG